MTLRQMTAVLMLLALLLSLGCSGGDGPDGSAKANAESERAALNALFTPVTEAAQDQSFHTPKDKLVETKLKLEDLRDRYGKLDIHSPVERARQEAVTHELARVNAALHLQEARAEWEALLKKANLTKKEQNLPLDEKRALLRQQWPLFRVADDEVIASERSYTDASNNLAAALKRVKLLEENG